MLLSKINTTNLSDDQINDIVFSDIDDSGKQGDVAIVFGNSDMINERTNKAIEMYKSVRVKKLLFTGGIGGITNTNGDTVSEAKKMQNMAIASGIPKEDIIIEEESNNSFENVTNSLKLLNISKINSIMIITSDFHLKRCLAILMKYIGRNIEYVLISVKNGYSDKENWFESERAWGTGRGIVMFEAEILVKYACEEKIYDLDIKQLNRDDVTKLSK